MKYIITHTSSLSQEAQNYCSSLHQAQATYIPNLIMVLCSWPSSSRSICRHLHYKLQRLLSCKKGKKGKNKAIGTEKFSNQLAFILQVNDLQLCVREYQNTFMHFKSLVIRPYWALLQRTNQFCVQVCFKLPFKRKTTAEKVLSPFLICA